MALTKITDKQVTYKEGSAGSVVRNLGEKLREVVSVKDFGAVGDGITDDTAAIQKAIDYVAASFSSDWFSTALPSTYRVVTLGPAHKVLGKLLLPTGIVIRGQNTTLIGSGFTGSDNICFETAYFNTGVLSSNIGTAPETARVQYSGIEGVRFINFKLALNLYNFNEGCRIKDCSFFNVRQALVAARSFYGRFSNLMARGEDATSTLPCFHFTDNVNAEALESIFVNGRQLGFQFDAGIFGSSLRALSAEGCAKGMLFGGNVGPLTIENCYFENLSDVALDFLSVEKVTAVTIDNNWFYNCPVGIRGAKMHNGKIGRGNLFVLCPAPVLINDVESSITVELPSVTVVSSAPSLLPAIPSGYVLGASVWVDQPSAIHDNGTGESLVHQNYSNNVTAAHFSGKQGYVPSKVAFCDHSKTAGTTFDVLIDTKILWDPYLMYQFAFTLADNVNVYTIAGRGYGNNVFFDLPSTKVLTASNNGGFLRLSVANLSNPTSAYTCEGVVGMVL